MNSNLSYSEEFTVCHLWEYLFSIEKIPTV